VISSTWALTVGLGPLLAGYIHDRTQSYDMFLYGGFVAAFVAALLLLSLGRYPDEPAPVNS
jgi:cyanate permease